MGATPVQSAVSGPTINVFSFAEETLEEVVHCVRIITKIAENVTFKNVVKFFINKILGQGCNYCAVK